jgi:hypothetical protein
LSEALLEAPEVRKLIFTELEDAHGTFRPRRTTIRVHDDVRPDQVHIIVRHEVCHALDDAFGGVDAVGEGSLADQSDMFGGTEWFGLEGEPRDRYAMEVFATMCGWGPAGLAAATLPCAADRTGHEDVATRVMEFAYGDWMPPFDEDFELRLDSDVAPEPDAVRVFDGGTLAFDFEGEPSIYVDVATLEPVSNPKGELVPHVDFDAGTLPIYGQRYASAMREDGGGLATVVPWSLVQPRLVGRVSLEQPWRPLRCTARTLFPPERPFVGPYGGLWLSSGLGGGHQVDEWLPAHP